MQVKVPAVGESITEATISEWNKKDGDFVQQDDALLVLETDKASVDIVAEQAGVLSIKAQEGETVEIGAVIAEIDTHAKSANPDTPSKRPAPPTGQPTSPPPPTLNGGLHPDLKEHLSPAVEKILTERKINPQTIEGTGKGGRLTKADALGAEPTSIAKAAPTVAATPKAADTPAPKKPIPPLPVVTGPSSQEEVRKPMSQLRKTIAKRLVEAQQTAAILTTFNEVDMTALYSIRDEYKEKFEKKHGIRLGFMSFFVKACLEALKEFPTVNAFIDGTDIVYHNYYNIGIAVGTPKGLVVPVIKDTDRLSLAQIEQTIRHYALKAREGKIAISDLTGGTFTISNGGVFGSLMSTPILNPPQSGILGMHKVEDRPVAINGKVEIRPMMYVALSYDHRVIDGSESVQFLVRIKECLEDPSRILLEA